jgi:hypothetical protein
MHRANRLTSFDSDLEGGTVIFIEAYRDAFDFAFTQPLEPDLSGQDCVTGIAHVNRYAREPLLSENRYESADYPLRQADK